MLCIVITISAIYDALKPLMLSIKTKILSFGGKILLVSCDGSHSHNVIKKEFLRMGFKNISDFGHILKCLRNSIVKINPEKPLQTPYSPVSKAPIWNVYFRALKDDITYPIPFDVVCPGPWAKMCMRLALIFML